jgi:hypothetical protein
LRSGKIIYSRPVAISDSVGFVLRVYPQTGNPIAESLQVISNQPMGMVKPPDLPKAEVPTVVTLPAAKPPVIKPPVVAAAPKTEGTTPPPVAVQRKSVDPPVVPAPKSETPPPSAAPEQQTPKSEPPVPALVRPAPRRIP